MHERENSIHSRRKRCGEEECWERVSIPSPSLTHPRLSRKSLYPRRVSSSQVIQYTSTAFLPLYLLYSASPPLISSCQGLNRERHFNSLSTICQCPRKSPTSTPLSGTVQVLVAVAHQGLFDGHSTRFILLFVRPFRDRTEGGGGEFSLVLFISSSSFSLSSPSSLLSSSPLFTSVVLFFPRLLLRAFFSGIPEHRKRDCVWL